MAMPNEQDTIKVFPVNGRKFVVTASEIKRFHKYYFEDDIEYWRKIETDSMFRIASRIEHSKPIDPNTYDLSDVKIDYFPTPRLKTFCSLRPYWIRIATTAFSRKSLDKIKNGPHNQLLIFFLYDQAGIIRSLYFLAYKGSAWDQIPIGEIAHFNQLVKKMIMLYDHFNDPKEKQEEYLMRTDIELDFQKLFDKNQNYIIF